MKKIALSVVFIAIMAITMGFTFESEAVCPNCADIHYICTPHCYLHVDICLPTQGGTGVYKLYYGPENTGDWAVLSLTLGSRDCGTGCSNYVGDTAALGCSPVYYTCFIQWEPTEGRTVQYCQFTDVYCD